MSDTSATASIYKRDGQIVVCANAMTRDGYPVDKEPFVMLSEPVDAGDLGRTVLEALNQFRDGADSASNDDFLSYFAMLAGVAKVQDVLLDARFCAIEQLTAEDGAEAVQFSPMLNDEGAFDDAASEPIVVHAEAGNEAIGRAAAKALGRAG